MKKATMKGLSIALASVLTMSMAAVNVSAYETIDADNYDMHWLLRESGTRADTVYINPEDLADGNYKLNVSMFIDTDEAAPETLEFIYSKWSCINADGDRTRFMRIMKPTSAGDLADYETDESVASEHPMAGLNEDGTVQDACGGILDGVLVKYVPTCVTQLITRNGQTQTTSKWFDLVSDYVGIMVENPHPTYGNGHPDVTVYSAGPGKVKFTNPFSGKEYICDVIYDDENQCDAHFDAREYYRDWRYHEPTEELLDIYKEVCGVTNEEEYFEYMYNQQEHWHTALLNYNPDIPEGEPLPNYAGFRRMGLFNPDLKHATQWLGERSDSFALTTFDVTIAPDTEEGVYYVSFVGDNNLMIAPILNEEGKIAKDINYYPDDVHETSSWLKIVVGDAETDGGNVVAEEEPADENPYDVNGDGVVDMQDASEALNMYAQSACGSMLLQSNSTQDDYFKLAQDILSDCAMRAAGLI